MVWAHWCGWKEDWVASLRTSMIIHCTLGTISLLLRASIYILIQFSSVAESYPTLCNPMDYSAPGFPVLHYFLEFAQTHVHWVGDAIQPSHPLLSPSPPAFNLSQHQGLFQWVSSLHQVARVLELQLERASVLPMNIQGRFLWGYQPGWYHAT